MRALNEIIRESAESPSLQEDWDRQLRTAKLVADFHAKGQRTVLLADEVGMGKTYVALATIAHHIFQSDNNDRKVMLVVPPNNVLARKWEQEIRTFNEKYLLDSVLQSAKKSLRPMLVADYWDLIRNLHDFQNCPTPRISDAMLACFSFSAWRWHQLRRKKGSWIREWKTYGKINEFDTDYLNFCCRYSPRALIDFLDAENDANPQAMASLVLHLNNGNADDGRLRTLMRRFGQNQDAYEANVFVIGMAKLRSSGVDHASARLLCSFIAIVLLEGCWEETRKTALKQLVKENLCVIPEGMAACGMPHQRWFATLGQINLWGMREAIVAALPPRGERDLLINQMLQGESLKALFKRLQEDAIGNKLTSSGIGLAVVDEVHNWKGGKNGASQFEQRYAPAIQNKLIMSATPFQLHQDELGRVFKSVAGEADQSMSVVGSVLAVGGTAEKCLQASDVFLKHWHELRAADLRLMNQFGTDTPPPEVMLASLRADVNSSPVLLAFLDSAEQYAVAVHALQSELAKIIIRHTKNRDKRHFHVGREYTVQGRPDYRKFRRTLYATSGYGDANDALMNFLAMRLDQLLRRDKPDQSYEANAHLMGGLTSSNKAFQDSNPQLLKGKTSKPETQRYLDFFASTLGSIMHPKVRATVQRAFNNLRRGQKTLIFCERLGTQTEILQSLEQLIESTIFPQGGLEQARRNRESMLKDHQAVELYLCRSWLASQEEQLRRECVNRLQALEKIILEATELKLKELGGGLSPRQLLKLVDLAALLQIVPTQDAHAHAVASLFDGNDDALRRYLRLKDDPEAAIIEDSASETVQPLTEVLPQSLWDVLNGPNIWHARSDAQSLHVDLWDLIRSEAALLSVGDTSRNLDTVAVTVLDLGQGLRKVLLRLDCLHNAERHGEESLTESFIRRLQLNQSHESSPLWATTHAFVCALNAAQGSIRRNAVRSSKRQSLWKGVFLREERIASEMNGETDQEKRINLCAAFNSPLLPTILVCTSIGSEGIDLHLHCADIIHHDMPWNPAKLEQRTGRVDRVGSLAEREYCREAFRLNIGVPFLAHNYEQFQYEKLLARAQKFEIILGKPEFVTDTDEVVVDEEGNEKVLETLPQDGLTDNFNGASLPEWLVDFLKMDLSIPFTAKSSSMQLCRTHPAP